MSKKQKVDFSSVREECGALRKLAALRASLCVLSTGNPLTSYDALQVFGWLRDFEEIISGPEWSTLSIDFRGIA